MAEPLPQEARDGIEAAFLRILRARHGVAVESLRQDRDPVPDRNTAPADDDGLQATA